MPRRCKFSTRSHFYGESKAGTCPRSPSSPTFVSALQASKFFLGEPVPLERPIIPSTKLNVELHRGLPTHRGGDCIRHVLEFGKSPDAEFATVGHYASIFPHLFHNAYYECGRGSISESSIS